MIINSTQVNENGIGFNQITHVSEYYYCAHDGVNVLIKTDEPVNGKTETQLQIFGSDTLENLQTEITNLGLIDLLTEEE